MLGVLDKKVCTNTVAVLYFVCINSQEQEQSLPAVQARDLYALHHTENPGYQGLGVSSRRQVVVRIRPSLDSDDSRSELLSSGNGFVRLNAEDTWEAGKVTEGIHWYFFEKK